MFTKESRDRNSENFIMKLSLHLFKTLSVSVITEVKGEGSHWWTPMSTTKDTGCYVAAVDFGSIFNRYLFFI